MNALVGMGCSEIVAYRAKLIDLGATVRCGSGVGPPEMKRDAGNRPRAFFLGVAFL